MTSATPAPEIPFSRTSRAAEWRMDLWERSFFSSLAFISVPPGFDVPARRGLLHLAAHEPRSLDGVRIPGLERAKLLVRHRVRADGPLPVVDGVWVSHLDRVELVLGQRAEAGLPR